MHTNAAHPRHTAAHLGPPLAHHPRTPVPTPMHPHQRIGMHTPPRSRTRIFPWIHLCLWALLYALGCGMAHAETLSSGDSSKEVNIHIPKLCVVAILPEAERNEWEELLNKQQPASADSVTYYGKVEQKLFISSEFTGMDVKKAIQDTFKSCQTPGDQSLFIAHTPSVYDAISGRQYLVPVRDGNVEGELSTWLEVSELLKTMLKQRVPSGGAAQMQGSEQERPLLMIVDSRVGTTTLHQTSVTGRYELRSLSKLHTWPLERTQEDTNDNTSIDNGSATLLMPGPESKDDFMTRLLAMVKGADNYDDFPPPLDGRGKTFYEALKRNLDTISNDKENTWDKSVIDIIQKRRNQAVNHHGLLSFEELKWYLQYDPKSPALSNPMPLSESRIGKAFGDRPLFWMYEYEQRRVKAKQPICNGFSEHQQGWINDFDTDKDHELSSALCPSRRYGVEYATDCNDASFVGKTMHRSAKTAPPDKAKEGQSLPLEVEARDEGILNDLRDNNCNGVIDELPKESAQKNYMFGQKWSDYRLYLEEDNSALRSACLTRMQVYSGLSGAGFLVAATVQVFKNVLPYRSCSEVPAGALFPQCNATQLPSDVTATTLQQNSRRALGFTMAGLAFVNYSLSLNLEHNQTNKTLKVNAIEKRLTLGAAPARESDRSLYRSNLAPVWLCRYPFSVSPRIRAIQQMSDASNAR